MNKILLTPLFLVLIKSLAIAQFHEIGGGVGISNAKTDMGHIHYANTRFSGSGFYRYNFNEVWVLRTELGAARFASRDSYYNTTQSKLRNAYFFTNQIQIAASVEFNFMNFRENTKFRNPFSPFLTVGIGNSVFFGTSQGKPISALNINIPMGIGAKYQVSKNWNVGMMFLAYKFFKDDIDNLNNDLPASIIPKIRNADLASTDWLHTLQFSVSYTIYKLKCPEHFELEVPTFWQRGYR
jgi:opacity protein-like surface antigen